MASRTFPVEKQEGLAQLVLEHGSVLLDHELGGEIGELLEFQLPRSYDKGKTNITLRASYFFSSF